MRACAADERAASLVESMERRESLRQSARLRGRETEAFDGARQRRAVDAHVQVAVRHLQLEAHAPGQPFDERHQKRAIDCMESPRQNAIPSVYSRQYAITRVSRYSAVSDGCRATFSAIVS